MVVLSIFLIGCVSKEADIGLSEEEKTEAKEVEVPASQEVDEGLVKDTEKEDADSEMEDEENLDDVVSELPESTFPADLFG